MKWIFAFSQGSEVGYEPLIRVAVASARARTALQPVCLYDGEATPLTRWLEAQGVQIVSCRSVFYEPLVHLAREQNNPNVLLTGAGTFLRLELPRVAREQGWSDEFVFYTDCDVMFERDPTPLLQPLRPRFFAAAPETFPDKPLHMNAGVMWINLAGLESQLPDLTAWARGCFDRVCAASWDQGALRVHFHPLHRFFWRLGVSERIFYSIFTRLPIRGWKWDDLPLELNWKPYWGQNAHAAIVHFHGLKPTQRAALKNGELPPNIAGLDGPPFRAYAARWDDWLEKAKDL